LTLEDVLGMRDALPSIFSLLLSGQYSTTLVYATEKRHDGGSPLGFVGSKMEEVDIQGRCFRLSAREFKEKMAESGQISSWWSVIGCWRTFKGESNYRVGRIYDRGGILWSFNVGFLFKFVFGGNMGSCTRLSLNFPLIIAWLDMFCFPC
jgi:hypothetical protein